MSLQEAPRLRIRLRRLRIRLMRKPLRSNENIDAFCVDSMWIYEKRPVGNNVGEIARAKFR